MASLAQFDTPSGSPNPAALVQTSALLECLHWDRRTEAEALLAFVGDARIVAWVYDLSVPSPNFACIVDGECLYIVITGTYTPDQWAGQILGATGEPYTLDPNTRVGAYWDRMWLPLAVAMSEFATPETTTIRITGHSYGGAVAHLIANSFARGRVPGQRIEVLNWAPPNPLTEGYTGPGPDVHHRVYHPDDVVPLLPPAGLNSQFYRLDGGGWLSSRSLTWGYYGRGWHMQTNGSIVRDPALRPTFGGAVGRLTALNLGVHRIERYTESAAALYETISGESSTRAWAPIAAAVGRLPPAPQQAVPANLQDWISAAAVTEVYFPGLARAVTIAEIAGLQSSRLEVPQATVENGTNIGFFLNLGGRTVSAFQKVTFIINNGRFGRQISFVLSGPTDFQSAVPLSTPLRAYIAGTFGYDFTGAFNGSTLAQIKSPGTPVIEYVRIGDALNPRVSRLFDQLPSGSTGFPNVTRASADFFAVAIAIRMLGATTVGGGRQSASSHLFVGQPDGVYDAAKLNFAFSRGGGVTQGDRMRDVLNELTNSTRQWGFMGIDPTEPKIALGPFTLVGGVWNFAVDPAPTWGARDRIRITESNARGFNGVWRVVPAAGGLWAIPRGPSTTIPGPTSAQGRRVQLANGTKLLVFYRFAHPTGGWDIPFGAKVRKKNPGREFSSESFRKKPRPVRQ